MRHAYNLIPMSLPAWLDFDGQMWDTYYLSNAQLAGQGWLPLIDDPEGAPLDYADPVEETRDGRQVAVAYALGTEQERADAALLAEQAQQANNVPALRAVVKELAATQADLARAVADLIRETAGEAR